jgi:hypothetical protein
MKSFLEWMAGEERDEKWLESERRRLMTWPREDLIAWLRWNDPNGSYTDEDAAAEDMEPLDVESAVDLIMGHVEENLETPEEMRAAAARQAHRQPAMPAAYDPSRWMRSRGG